MYTNTLSGNGSNMLKKTLFSKGNLCKKTLLYECLLLNGSKKKIKRKINRIQSKKKVK